MASHQEIRRRPSAADRTTVEPALAAMATTTTLASSSSMTPDLVESPQERFSDEFAMPPPSTPIASEKTTGAGRPRTTSLATRNANRLSLTLPIAPPTSDPSRPTPSTGGFSVPPTPVDSSAAASPSDPNDFIIAIAAQERKVLELREQLAQAEAELTSLKRRWTVKDHKRSEARQAADARRRSALNPDEENLSAKQSIEIDRKKLLLQNQSTPTQGRRKIIRGGHARTLSLLSPTKSDSGFSDLQDREPQSVVQNPMERRNPQLFTPNLAKRASWQPRSNIGSTGFVEDFRLGLRAFVEDIRQITVGDEPITGQAPRDTPATGRDMDTDLGFDTIKASNSSARPKVSNVFDSPDPAAATPTPASKDAEEKPKLGAKNKRFSWTPLGFDSLDDHGWSSWDSPSSAKSARWSGSTINSDGADSGDIKTIAEMEENGTPIKKKSGGLDGPILSPKLEEILPNVVNRLSPSNIKRTANQLLDEWEKSLIAPQVADKENQV